MKLLSIWIRYIPFLIFFFVFKWFIATGSRFNGSLWDYELVMLREAEEAKFLSSLIQPDPYGYLQIPIRLIISFAKTLEGYEIFTLRAIVIMIQLFCILFFFTTFTHLGKKKNFIILSVLLLIPNEDMNYIYNVSYYFLLVILALWRFSQNSKKDLQLFLGLISGFLICKPLVSFVIIGIVILELVSNYRSKSKLRAPIYLIVLVTLSLLYLLTYQLERDKLDPPFMFEYTSIFKVIFNFPYVVGTTFLPMINIGLIGFLHDIELGTTWLTVVGTLVYLVNLGFLLLLFRSGPRSEISIRPVTITSVERQRIHLVFFALIASYLSNYMISNYYYTTEFPLWNLGYSPRIWMRYSANIPILSFVLLIMVKKGESLGKYRKVFLVAISVQYIILWIFARFVFLRWYM